MPDKLASASEGPVSKSDFLVLGLLWLRHGEIKCSKNEWKQKWKICYGWEINGKYKNFVVRILNFKL